MIADLKPYPEYRESGLPWIGQIPSHWDLIPNRGLVRRRKMLVGKRHTEYHLLSLTKQGVIVRDTSTGKGKFSSDMGTSQEVRTGDFVFCLFDVPETPRTVGLSRHNGMITGAYTVFESTGRANARYVELFYLAMDDRKLLSPLYSGLRNTIPAERLLGTKTPQPPADEQDSIVRFLDWANGRLERAIRAKRRVIALLNEQKRAIIHGAVTRGLDPSVPLKPSGVPWLSDVPDHWTIMPLKHAFSSMDYGISDPTFDAGQIRVLGMGHIKDGEITVPEDGGVNTVDPLLFLKDGDLLFNRTNSSALVGKVGIFRGHATPVTFASYLVRMRPKPGFDSEYLNFLLNSSAILNVARQFSIPSLHQSNLNPARYGRLAIAVPGLEEQQQILRHLINKCRPLNEAIRKADLTAQRIAEYRTRLAADVVTGKLDVREAVSRLPNEVVPEIIPEEGTDLVLETVDAGGFRE